MEAHAMPIEPIVNGGNGTKPDWVPVTRWVPIIGQWEITESGQRFLGEGMLSLAHGQSFPMGLAVSSATMQNGICRVQIRFAAPFGDAEQAAGIVMGYRSPEQHYIFAELGAARSAYSVGEYVSGFGWRSLAATGQLQNLQRDRSYTLQLNLRGQELRILVDDVPVMEHLLPHPLEGRQVGIIAAGNNEVSFSDFVVSSGRPKAFVVMQFAEPYDTFYREVIQPQVCKAGFEVFRIDEKAGPGIIFQDIQREIEQAEIVIAEITPANPNVFYELGYAHALHKPTILLARRESQLPFDIRSYRVVFYNDTIGGKAEVEQSLRKHLEAIAGR
jgi:hypothetical protein